VRLKPSRLSKVEEGVVDEQAGKWLKNEVVEPSGSERAFPAVVVRKMDAAGKVTKRRVAADCRRLAKVLRGGETAHPLTLVDSCLDSVRGSTFFSVCDLQQACRQVDVGGEGGPVARTALAASKGQWQLLRCPLGIKNLPSLWSRIADTVFQGLKRQIVSLCTDDLCTFSKDFDQHLKGADTVLKRAEDAGLTTTPRKCKWRQEEVEFLGFTVGRQGVRASPEKVKALLHFPKPTNVKALRSFPALASCRRRLVLNFSRAAGPLNALLAKGAPWGWGEQQQEAFEALKEATVSPPVVAYPGFSKPFVLFTGASNRGLGATLTQEDGKGRERATSCAGRALSVREKNYSATHKEGLAVVWAVQKLRPLPFWQ